MFAMEKDGGTNKQKKTSDFTLNFFKDLVLCGLVPSAPEKKPIMPSPKACFSIVPWHRANGGGRSAGPSLSCSHFLYK